MSRWTYVTRRARLTLVSILLLVVMFSAGLFWFVSERVTEQATTVQIDEILQQTQKAAADMISASTGSIGRATEVIAGAQRADDTALTDYTMFNALQLAPELSGNYVAGSDGSFRFVFRTEEGYGTKVVTPATDSVARSVIFTERDTDFVVLREWTDDTDTYDPRTRAWFSSASATPGQAIWSDAYIFFTSQRPGITHAVSDPDQGWVVGVDVELQSLVELLDALSTTIAGEVFLTNGTTTALTGKGLVDLTQPETPADARVRQAIDASIGELGGQGDDDDDDGENRIEYDLIGEEHTVGISSLNLSEGSNWSIVTDIAASDVPVSVSNLVRGLQILALAITAASVVAIAGFGIQATRPITELERASKIDSLTSLPNRRAILQTGEMASSSGTLRAVAMIDVDRFKRVNDTYGHAVGDEVLKGLAKTFLLAACEIGRLGGEEFVMLIKTEELADAAFAEMLRSAVEIAPIDTSAGPIPVTISIGLARRAPEQSFTQTMRLADGALLEAKLNGRNRLVVVDRTVAVSHPA